MAQHIGCILEGEEGRLLQDSGLNFAPINSILWQFDAKKKKYPWLHTIDEYCNTIFNPLQIPYLVEEFKTLNNEAGRDDQILILQFIDFISKVKTHQYIKFIGD